ncbi:hypothetical protein JG687_00011764 [Phytophthora cactorum]|uniref:Uncharacterized protein n=1 Tax=Phytophthora cactorum TaxID=29920 RepID=A0A8T1U7G1_9STRA|nr:hypothetical protein JG687_00011764 [Phytophthora cactorum]
MDNASVTTSVSASTGLHGMPESTPCDASTVVMVPPTVVSPSPEIRMFLIDPPPESLYDSYNDAESVLHAWTKASNYNVSLWMASYLPGFATVKFAQYFECGQAPKYRPSPGRRSGSNTVGVKTHWMSNDNQSLRCQQETSRR